MATREKSWRHRLADLLRMQPEDRAGLVQWLTALQKDHNVLTPREMSMMRGILLMSQWKIRDVMISRSDVVGINERDSYARLVATVREWQHSRYPIFDAGGENITGLLLAKDLLVYADHPDDFNISRVARPVMFQPESKSLDLLLDDFRVKRSHLVVALDEFSQPSGIVTIEDVLERIVGEIFDESDEQDDSDTSPLPDGLGHSVKGTLSVEEFNEQFGADLPSGIADSVAGWLAAEMGRIPSAGEIYRKHNLTFQVTKADLRRVYLINIWSDTSKK